MSDRKTIKLTKPIMAHGEECKTLTMREPTTEDIIACGIPFTMGEKGTEINTRVTAKLISRLCAIPEGAVGKLAPSDFMNAWVEISSFLTPADSEGSVQTPSADIKDSPSA